LITGHSVAPAEPAFAVACKRAASGELGAADLVWNQSEDCVELALILEPEVALVGTREIFLLAATALADSLGALMPPMTAVLLRWPSTILINAARAGSLQFAASTVDDAEIPDWIVIGVTLNLQRPPANAEADVEPGTTSLFDEGGGDLDRNKVLESFAAHMLTWIHAWQEEGFAAAHDQLLGRIEGHEKPAAISARAGATITGRVLAVTDDMYLLVRGESDGVVSALSLAAALQDHNNAS